jgi:serine/threonine protein kinase
MEEPKILNNRYQLLEPLGKGGMAIVYRARDLMLERLVAVKVLREDYSGDPAFQERFRQEAKAAANLSHPNIVTMHDFGLDNGQLFLVMEYVPGTDLKTLIKQRGRFNPEEALPLLIQACAGIGYAHRAGLVHCDVKPQNMLVTPDMRLKVADFGIARALSTSLRGGSRSSLGCLFAGDHHVRNVDRVSALPGFHCRGPGPPAC